jgi:hypothetical protein
LHFLAAFAILHTEIAQAISQGMRSAMSQKTVDTSVICAWLGIPPDQWPPDHYTLLGLAQGERDADRIERQVQQRLEQVRRYQLANPEPATEAMNRLAQAFVCLTDPRARQAYDRALFGEAGAPTPAATTVTAETPATETEQHPVDPEFLSLVEEEVRSSEPVPVGPAPVLPVERVEPLLEEAAPAKQAGKRLGTRRALYKEIVQTRALLQLWARAGKYIGQTKRRLTRPSEARDLIEVLTAIRRHIDESPRILGEAGQPGYLVVALARQPAIVPTFQTLLPSQREALARDCSAGQKVLAEHRDFLREEARSLRRRTIFQRSMRIARYYLNEHPAGWLIVLGLLALAIAVVRDLFVD